MDDIKITWDRGSATIQRLGAMVAPIRFTLDDKRTIEPMAIGPWGDDRGPEYEALPGLLQRLRGEWPCVPFGAPSAPVGLPDGWTGTPADGLGGDFHGYSGHHVWDIEEAETGKAVLSIAYPDDHAIAGLRRTIAGVSGKACLDVTLEITARRKTCCPIALHPVFQMPQEPGRVHVDIGSHDHGRVFPLPVEPGVSRLVPDSRFVTLDAVPSVDGSQSLTHLPLVHDTEELVQLMGVDGAVQLTDAEAGHAISLSYDSNVFPSLLIWISNRGRTAYPWNGRFCAVGLEPVRGAFDLGPEIGANPDNPIAAAGFPTCLALEAGETFSTRYAISAQSLRP